MRTISVLSICLIFLLTNCSPEKAKLKPSVPKEKMISVLVDIHLLEARAEELKELNDTFITVKRAAYDSIFIHHDVNKDEFLKTFNWYEEHPQEMDLLYEMVVDSFSVLEANSEKSEH